MAEERPTLEPIQREWYSVTEVALRLGISERRVWKMLSQGELKAHRMGQKLVRIHRDEISRYESEISEYEADDSSEG